MAWGAYGEVFASLDGLEPEAAQHSEDGVSESGEDLWRIAGAGLVFVFAESDVADGSAGGGE